MVKSTDIQSGRSSTAVPMSAVIAATQSSVCESDTGSR